MSTHKNVDKICCIFLVIAMIITVIFMNADRFGIKAAERVMGYEDTLFDTSKVHTIDIVMDDWDSFIENASDKEYSNCTVVIDNDKVSNVGLRAKGNSSLSMVKSSDSDRYSFKIEFDHYDKNKTYKGLDKLCLNNIIQDNTYMKDYLSYNLMNDMGVASPLCSYISVKINGEDYGLYLAVEALEDSFLERNYGSDSGDLYKPESEQGNPKGDNKDNQNNKDGVNRGDGQNGMPPMQNGDNQNGVNNQLPPMPDGDNQNGVNNQLPPMQNGDNQNGMSNQLPPMPDGDNQNGGDNQLPPMQDGDNQNGMNSQLPPMPDGDNGNGQNAQQMQGRPGNMMGSSSDESLNYIDDDEDSYSYIFDNAVTKISGKDKKKVISALKNISNNTDLEDSLDTDEIINYFVVHNYLLNFDSYTGSIMHNYYLYENNGKLTMLPWDYNLSFTSFMTNYTTQSLVNFPIDTPVSTGTVDSRGMLKWILDNEEYTEKYHEKFNEFISKVFDSGDFEKEVDRVEEMISPYVEKDTSKFCTYDEFKAGVSTLKEFCSLRAESIKGQLDGTIGSTTDTQQNDENLIDTGDLDVTSMGSENMNKGNMNKGNIQTDNTNKGNMLPDRTDKSNIKNKSDKFN